MYKYETHLHTYPVSGCARATVEQTLDFYKAQGYDGAFITNHFLDGNINIARTEPYEKKIEFYFSDYERGVEYGKKIGIKVFLGIEMSYGGTDFLVYGLDKQWFFEHPQVMELRTRQKLEFLRDNGAYIVQAHPFREAYYIDHIRLFPRSVEAVEVINASRGEFENRLAREYAQNYGLAMTAGSDNHIGAEAHSLGGVITETPLETEADYIRLMREGRIEIFHDII